jgi:hypothetical protein
MQTDLFDENRPENYKDFMDPNDVADKIIEKGLMSKDAKIQKICAEMIPYASEEKKVQFIGQGLNTNNFDVYLSGWKIQDTAGTITTFTINPSARASTELSRMSSGQAAYYNYPD